MNTLFIDIEQKKANSGDRSKEENAEKARKIRQLSRKLSMKVLGMKIEGDFLNTGIFSNTFSFVIKETLIADMSSKKWRHRVKMAIICNIWKQKLKGKEKLNLVFSRYFDEKEMTDEKEKIRQIFTSIKEITVNEIQEENTMIMNDMGYIETYVRENKINLNKLKILVAINKFDDYNEQKMIEYIQTYKFVDILKMKDVSKQEYAKLVESIAKINEEYGSTIEITQKRNIQEYTIYLMYSPVKKNEFITHYIVKKKSKYIEITDASQDIAHKNMKEYQRKKYEIETLLKRIKLEMSSYSKNKLGAWLLQDTNRLDK